MEKGMPAQQKDYYSFNSPLLCSWYAYMQLFNFTSYLNSIQIMYVFSVSIDSLDQVDSKEVITVNQINYMHFQNIYVQSITELMGKVKSIFKITYLFELLCVISLPCMGTQIHFCHYQYLFVLIKSNIMIYLEQSGEFIGFIQELCCCS